MKLPNEIAVTRSRLSLLALALFVSVLLNLFLVGAFMGVVPGAKQHHSFGPMMLAAPHGEYMVDWMAHYLDPADAAVLRDAVKDQTDALKQAHDQVHQAIGDVASTFEQDPPDPSKLNDALNLLAQAKGVNNEVVGRILQAAYPKLSAEGRHRLADLTQNPM